MLNEFILEHTTLSFNTVQCKTNVTCIFPNVLSLSRPYIMQKLQTQVYSYKHVYMFCK